jgi:mannose-1-phosphate guanylyltransferase
MKKICFVILAGGSGERLWPLSNKSQPKQLIPFLGKNSLLEQTVSRVEFLAESKDQILVVTNEVQKYLIEEQVGARVGDVLAEPAACNTAPAILWAALKVFERDEDSVIVVLPADHFIPNKELFAQHLQRAVEYAKTNEKLVTFGLKPRYAATGYGYIQADLQKQSSCCDGWPVLKFHEKPPANIAECYSKQPDMFWNIGIFVGKAAVFLREFELLAKGLFDGMQLWLRGKQEYKDLPCTSIDYAIMEKSQEVVVFAADFDWYDVGDLNTFLSLELQFSNNEKRVIEVEGSGNLGRLSGNKILACVGVSDLCVVESNGVILIVSKEKVNSVKQAIPKAKMLLV